MNKERLNRVIDETIKWCLYAIVFAAPFSKSISEIGITVAIIAWAVQKILNRDLKFKQIELGFAFVVFAAAIIPSFINTAYPALSMKAFFTKVLKYIFLCIVMADTIRTKERLKDILLMAFISIVVIMADGFIQYYTTGYDVLHNYPAFKIRTLLVDNDVFRGFPTASFPFPNDLAAWILLMIAPLSCIALFGMKKQGMKYLMMAVSAGLFYLFFLAKVRSAWIALAMSMVYVAVSKRKMWIFLLLVAILAGSILIKTETTSYMFSTSGFGHRFKMMDTSWQVFMKHPVIGSGLNTFFVNYMKYRNDEFKGKKGSYAHNCYLQMAADTGLVGLSGFLFLLFSYFRAVIRQLKVIKDEFYRTALWGISIGVFAFLVHSFFDTNLYSLNLATLFWFAIGTSLAFIRVSKTTGL
ncbi:MAG: O-antigen ligase family protein [Candidatus Omnitrophica bacterium]|nr:O-antigen ligase family protein [Candidatus Omnitrophota bacterium]